MQKRNSGNVIINIKHKKNTTDIYFYKDKITIPKETFYHKNYKIGDYIPAYEIKEISIILDTNKILNYAMNLLKRCHYSEQNMRDKLSKKTSDSKIIDKVIMLLKQYDLINDEMLILDYIESANEKHYGKNKIINNLLKMGINKKNIKNDFFLKEIEEEKATILITKLLNKYEDLSHKNKIKHLENNLLNKGFDYQIIKSVIKDANIINNDSEIIKKIYEQELNKIVEANVGSYNKDKIYNKLRNKGFSHEDILEVINYD